MWWQQKALHSEGWSVTKHNYIGIIMAIEGVSGTSRQAPIANLARQIDADGDGDGGKESAALEAKEANKAPAKLPSNSNGSIHVVA